MYYFKYDKEGFLIKYKEFYVNENRKSCLCELYIFDNKIIKFEEDKKFKSFTKYTEPIKVTHRFEVNESWLNINKKNNTNSLEEESHKVKEELVQKNYPFDFNKHDESEKHLERLKKYQEYPLVGYQINLEDDLIYNLKFKIKETLIKNWNF